MGRKKIEIRPLVDERNRNVTFLKRKAGLMKKAWELSVLCAADVSIIIFSAAGKAYEFSSQELDSEIDRYMDYEGMIERRRAPEFAAMAAAGEDDDDEDDDDAPRRGSLSKGKGNGANGGAGGSGAGAGANGNGPAVPRSLKGKETYKARTQRESGPAPNQQTSSRNKGRSKAKKNERKGSAVSEKRSFVGGILSGSESDDESDDESPSPENTSRAEELQGRIAATSKVRSSVHDSGKDRRKDKRMRREEDRSVADREQSVPRNVCSLRADSVVLKLTAHRQQDMLAGVHYALNMHNGAIPASSGERAHIPREHHQSHHTTSTKRSSTYNHADYASQSQPPMVVPRLPRLPSDAISYRMPNAPTAPLPVEVSQMPLPSHPNHQSYGYASGQVASSSTFPQYGQQPFLGSGNGSYTLPYPYQQHQSQNPHPFHGQSQNHDASAYVPPGFGGVQPNPSDVQWDSNLLARYAEFQLQQNHQRQQRLLLERQRQQLAELGVPVDERSLLDDIFGGVGSGAGGGAGMHSGHAMAGSGRGTPSLSAADLQSQAGTGEFIWPLAEGSAHSGGVGGGGGGVDINQGDNYINRDDQVGAADVDWGFDGVGVGMDEGDRRIVGGIPSPVSNSAGEPHKKGRSRESISEVGDGGMMAKRIRL